MATVLIVEDDKDLAYVYRMALGQAGHDVTMARSGKQARQALEAQIPDMVFLDMNMPDESGLDIIHYMRADERYCNVQIVVVTANNLWRREIDAADIDQFLVKPVRITDMVQLAARLAART